MGHKAKQLGRGRLWGRSYTAEALEVRRLFGSINQEFRVNSFVEFPQFGPALATDADGDFVVVWQSDGQTEGADIYAKRYSRLGGELVPPPEVPRGVDNEFRVNTTFALNQNNPVVAIDSDGDFVVAWETRDLDAVGGY